jgi:hypothetical protein
MAPQVTTGICLMGWKVDDKKTTMLDLKQEEQDRYMRMIPSTGRTLVHHVC